MKTRNLFKVLSVLSPIVLAGVFSVNAMANLDKQVMEPTPVGIVTITDMNGEKTTPFASLQRMQRNEDKQQRAIEHHQTMLEAKNFLTEDIESELSNLELPTPTKADPIKVTMEAPKDLDTIDTGRAITNIETPEKILTDANDEVKVPAIDQISIEDLLPSPKQIANKIATEENQGKTNSNDLIDQEFITLANGDMDTAGKWAATESNSKEKVTTKTKTVINKVKNDSKPLISQDFIDIAGGDTDVAGKWAAAEANFKKSNKIVKKEVKNEVKKEVKKVAKKVDHAPAGNLVIENNENALSEMQLQKKELDRVKSAEAEKQKIADDTAAKAKEQKIADDTAAKAKEQKIADDMAAKAKEQKIADDMAAKAKEQKIADDTAAKAKEQKISKADQDLLKAAEDLVAESNLADSADILSALKTSDEITSAVKKDNLSDTQKKALLAKANSESEKIEKLAKKMKEAPETSEKSEMEIKLEKAEKALADAKESLELKEQEMADQKVEFETEMAEQTEKVDLANKAYCEAKTDIINLEEKFQNFEKNIIGKVSQAMNMSQLPTLMNFLAQNGPRVETGFNSTFAERFFAQQRTPGVNYGVQMGSLADLFNPDANKAMNYNVYNVTGDWAGGNINKSPISGGIRTATDFAYNDQLQRQFDLDNAAIQNSFRSQSVTRPFSFNFDTGSIIDSSRFQQLGSQNSFAHRSQIERNMEMMNSGKNMFTGETYVPSSMPRYRQLDRRIPSGTI